MSAERAASRRFRHDFARDSEQARADFQAVRLGGGRRNVETDLVLDDDEIDHAAQLEPFFDPDGKSAGTQQARHPRPIGPGEFPSRSSAQCVHLSFTYPPRAISLAVAGFPNSTWPESMRFCPTTESSSSRCSRHAIRM